MGCSSNYGGYFLLIRETIFRHKIRECGECRIPLSCYGFRLCFGLLRPRYSAGSTSGRIMGESAAFLRTLSMPLLQLSFLA